MSDELDVLRAPVPVGATRWAPPNQGSPVHPVIDARSIVAVPGPTHVRNPERSAPAHPPDPLGVLDPDDPSARVLTATAARPVRRRWVAGLTTAAVAACAVGFAVYVGRDDGVDDGGDLIAGGAAPDTVVEGVVRSMRLSWGPNPGVCATEQEACYVVAVTLDGYAPGRELAMACVVPGRPTPDVTIVTVDDIGETIVRVPCAENRSARAVDVTVDGEVAATLELPTTIVPSPIVSFTNDRSAMGQAGCAVEACRFVDVTLTGYEPGSEVTVSCYGESVGSFSPTAMTIGVDGTATQEACYFGYPGEQFWVEADGVSSETITWPGE